MRKSFLVAGVIALVLSGCASSSSNGDILSKLTPQNQLTMYNPFGETKRTFPMNDEGRAGLGDFLKQTNLTALATFKALEGDAPMTTAMCDAIVAEDASIQGKVSDHAKQRCTQDVHADGSFESDPFLVTFGQVNHFLVLIITEEGIGDVRQAFAYNLQTKTVTSIPNASIGDPHVYEGKLYFVSPGLNINESEISYVYDLSKGTGVLMGKYASSAR